MGKQMKGLLGEKLGMTQVFDENNRMVPVTVVAAGPCSAGPARDRPPVSCARGGIPGRRRTPTGD
jgi:hypothetical protein